MPIHHVRTNCNIIACNHRNHSLLAPTIKCHWGFRLKINNSLGTKPSNRFTMKIPKILVIPFVVGWSVGQCWCYFDSKRFNDIFIIASVNCSVQRYRLSMSVSLLYVVDGHFGGEMRETLCMILSTSSQQLMDRILIEFQSCFDLILKMTQQKLSSEFFRLGEFSICSSVEWRLSSHWGWLSRWVFRLKNSRFLFDCARLPRRWASMSRINQQIWSVGGRCSFIPNCRQALSVQWNRKH